MKKINLLGFQKGVEVPFLQKAIIGRTVIPGEGTYQNKAGSYQNKEDIPNFFVHKHNNDEVSIPEDIIRHYGPDYTRYIVADPKNDRYTIYNSGEKGEEVTGYNLNRNYQNDLHNIPIFSYRPEGSLGVVNNQILYSYLKKKHE